MAKKKIELKHGQPFVLEELLSEINKKYGEGTICLASEAVTMEVEFFSSGNYALDFAIGGGIPKNRITQIQGAFSAGKTTTCLKAVAEFQKAEPEGYVMFVDLEKSLDLKYARVLGVDLFRMLVIRPDSGEQAVDVCLDILSKSVEILMIIDSVPALIPLAEVAQSIEQNHMGKQPQLVGRMVKMMVSRMKRSLTNPNSPSSTVILINQMREKVGIPFGNPEYTPGGRAKDYFAGLTIELRAKDKIEETVNKHGIERKVLLGREYFARILKNKVGGMPMEECTYKYWTMNTATKKFGTYDNAEVLFEHGVFRDVIQLETVKKKSVYCYSCMAGKIREIKPASFIEALAQQPKIAKALRKAIIKKIQQENSPEHASTQELDEEETISVE